MDKDMKEHIRVPLLGFAAVLFSVAGFVLVLYLITVVIRVLFLLG